MRPVVLIAAFTALPVVLAVAVLAQRERVRNEAEALAGQAPYCIQVPARDAEYRPVADWIDLSVFVSRGAGPLHHAVLVIGPHERAELFHWSYKSQRFLKGIAGRQPIYCDPRVNYLSTASATGAGNRTSLNLYMAGRHLSIPRAYQPEPLWASEFALLFYATAPRFQPVIQRRSPVTDIRSQAAFFALLPSQVKVKFALRGLETHLRVPDAHHLVEPSADAYGLKTQAVRARLASQPVVQYFLRSPDARVITLIGCFVQPDAECSHSFEHEGWTYDFRHRHSDIQDWQAMQQRLVDLTRSFCQDRSLD